MRIFMIFLSFLFLTSCTSSYTRVSISPGESLVLNSVEQETLNASLKNKSGWNLTVKVMDNNSGQVRSGFGMESYGNTDVVIQEYGVLSVTNTSSKAAKMKYLIEKKTNSSVTEELSNREYVSFTLLNKSPRSIPLLIPSVMNPNLSPFSSSGVDLKIGQEILFRENGKKYVLLVVDESIQDGAEIEVASLLRAKKKELDL